MSEISAKSVQELRQRLDQVSRLRTPVLLVGEPGCGFEIAARTPLVDMAGFAPLAEVLAAQGGR